MKIYSVCATDNNGTIQQTQRMFFNKENAEKWMKQAKTIYKINHNAELFITEDNTFDENENNISDLEKTVRWENELMNAINELGCSYGESLSLLLMSFTCVSDSILLEYGSEKRDEIIGNFIKKCSEQDYLIKSLKFSTEMIKRMEKFSSKGIEK